ncbi:hypothetical protein BU14_0299s0017 [Porphyra umbilicalis]|uniref:Uncharacterized protein n=1 Tax=Porphyra umbilicalis TaxID=2786 RepID=A0A1X6P055_PORUM|nr:hypothetical protein BU14_0299s0017 [Porphyra umbilicalis]|eukprot:OSX74249.1 hypothetical protein BU14_0299s0017 [Porphyra umbilicalis]
MRVWDVVRGTQQRDATPCMTRGERGRLPAASNRSWQATAGTLERERRHIAVERARAVRLAETECVARQLVVEIELLANHGALKIHIWPDRASPPHPHVLAKTCGCRSSCLHWATHLPPPSLPLLLIVSDVLGALQPAVSYFPPFLVSESSCVFLVEPCDATLFHPPSSPLLFPPPISTPSLRWCCCCPVSWALRRQTAPRCRRPTKWW